ncbi:hypothetical protein TRM7557_00833 [Tritonibacter multivorans]|uniref:AlgX/AlgJ SGNH hydrolase-like domain-containing protein n=1 Tax=Tritonibacter multivorans TaxID=928856 RepID=A0A0P1G3B4_9RHOB|nr:hypothetical protein [Tritonibacter multivorans]MDA7422529.1 hypothetical protein [Tritonibacter multivorans]CUH76319.1 hypothetical protein TRM7557_00833 [Tritonibacter multivorans]SFD39931.1 alginate O-acetyltransferase complex protein AlgJ [Tritonibacter multivorans]
MLPGNIPQTAAAFGFVLALSGVGVLSHLRTDHSFAAADLRSGAWQAGYEDAFEAANPLEGFAITALGTLRYALFRQGSDGVLVGHAGWLFTAEEFETAPGFAARIETSAEYVTQVVGDMAAQGIAVLPVLVPDKSDLYPQHLRHKRPKELLHRRDRFYGALEARGVSALDASPALLQAAQTGPVFMRTDTHWSPHGSRSVAEAAAQHALAAGLFAPGTTEVETTSLGAQPFVGDLIRFVPTGALRPVFGPPPETLVQYVTTVESSLGLFDAADVPVVLVGTSFSARSEFHFEGFLKQALRSDVINYAREGTGPFAPMEQFLASDTLKNSPPQLVIWEIPLRYVSKDLLP